MVSNRSYLNKEGIMEYNRFISVITIIFLTTISIFAQQNKTKYQNSVELAWNLISEGDFNEANQIVEKYLKIEKLSEKEKADFLNIKASILIGQGEYFNAISTFKNAIQLNEKNLNQEGTASSLSNLGIAYTKIGLMNEALQVFKKSKIIYEKLHQSEGITNQIINIGNVFYNISNYEKAEFYYNEALILTQKNNFYSQEIDLLNNLGNIYLIKEDNKKALNFYNKAIELSRNQGLENKVIYTYNSIGEIFQTTGNLELAEYYFTTSNSKFKELGNIEGQINSLISLTSLCLEKNNIREASNFSDEAFDLCKKSKSSYELLQVYYLQYLISKRLNKTNIALEKIELLKYLSDSLNEIENQQNVAEKELVFEYKLKSLNEEKKRIQILNAFKQREDRRKNLKWSLIGGLLSISAFSFFLYRRLRIEKKQMGLIKTQKNILETTKNELADKKLLLEIKGNEIRESLEYAFFLQSSINSEQKDLEQVFKEAFIINNPKDIVSGDFVFLKRIETHDFEYIYFAVADATGHGVPGAIISMACSISLNQVISGQEGVFPSEVLLKVNQIIKKNLGDNDKKISDGMDISLLLFQRNLKNVNEVKFYWSGANNPLILMRKGSMFHFKPNRGGIGKDTEVKEFHQIEDNLMEGDQFYLFTDGFQDQFGGQSSKKIGIKKIKELLLKIEGLNHEKQKILLQDFLIEWKNENEQTDDICFVGIKPI